MSTFMCEKCNKTCHDTPRGYVTGCKHYPPDTDATNHLYKEFLETRKALEDLWKVDGFVPDELMDRIKKLLNES